MALCAPDTGDLLYACKPCDDSDQCHFVYLSGAPAPVLPIGDSCRAIGRGGRYLIQRTNDTYILNPDGSHTPVPGLFAGAQYARSAPEGFWLLNVAAVGTTMSRVDIAYDGTSQRVPFPPSPVELEDYGTELLSYALDGQGRVIATAITGTVGDSRSLVLRFDPATTVGEILMDGYEQKGISLGTQRANLFTGR